MREHYNNLSKIQAQVSKSESQIETGYRYFLRYLYNQLLKASGKFGILRLAVSRYGLII